MNMIYIIILCLMCALNLQAQEVSQSDTTVVMKLSSPEMNVWNKNKRDGNVQLNVQINENDTTFTLFFCLRDMKGLEKINYKSPLKLVFDDGRVLVLRSNAAYSPGYGSITHVFIGLIPLFYSEGFEVLYPSYEIEKENLLKVLEGKVTSLIFTMKDREYTVPVLSNRFVDVLGEECASLKMAKGTKLPDGTPAITSKTLFGDAKLRHNRFGWNNSLVLSVGFDHLHTRLDGMMFTNEMPRNLFSMDCMVKGLYLGGSVMSKDAVEHYSYTKNCSITTGVIKIGPAFRYGNMRSRVVFAPYIGSMTCALYDKDQKRRNKIDSESDMVMGVRLSYIYKHFEVSTNVSNHEVGVNIGCAL